MKKLLLSLSLLFIGASLEAQTLLSENFEGTTFPPTGWTRSSTVTSRPWDFTPVVFGTGASSFVIAGTKSAGINYIAQANTANLVSPSFSLVGAASPSLNFKAVVGYSYMIALDAGNLLAQISTNGGTTWTTLWTEDGEAGFMDDGDGNDNTDLYNQNIVSKQISLTPYIGQANVQIRFQYTGNDADGVSIDDVTVTATTLSTNEAGKKLKATNIYPNPTKGEINIKTDKKIKSSTILDFSGKSVLKSTSDRVDISSLPKGGYLLQVEFSDGTTTSEKVIKE
ncbi:T9SS type A sorting domain-containing protein [Chryseobacterium limigenitum]|uniref:Por secretion system C-terminal sorting domain-containing protein n=1 Tax=Chryseobacterium limigenitum TaxID=1612149 RepID=A0A1K2IS00_9FLAO|nr:T9SS type A sorting domain-containing protein [Chryseobacterium limigenitum]SFZ95026.1 Por secretion system C-terminal sorting domain-containing protein [Chryseobacterium limigenitum]